MNNSTIMMYGGTLVGVNPRNMDDGDSMNMAFSLVIAGLALAAMAAVVVTRRRLN